MKGSPRSIQFSVVIPTYNRKASLRRSIAALLRSGNRNLLQEIIVVDDGGDTSLDLFLHDAFPENKSLIRYIRQQNQGPAAARNNGFYHAESDHVLFLQDDIEASERLLSAYVDTYRMNASDPVAVIGKTVWHPRLRITPFLHYLDSGGRFLGFQRIQDHANASFYYFCSGNVSVKKSLCPETLFDETFPYAAYEDIELGLRLQRKGVRLVYNEEAVAFHNHHMNPASFCERSILTGRAAVIFHEKHPDVKKLPGVIYENDNLIGNRLKDKLKKLCYPFLKNGVHWLDRAGFKLPDIIYQKLIDYYTIEGIKIELSEREKMT